jgi:DNA-binding NarL/FixJ family response regulator
MTATRHNDIIEVWLSVVGGRKSRNETMTQPIRVLIADNDARARAGLRVLLATWPEVEVVGEAIDGQDAMRLIEECHPATVLMDLQMPIMDGAQATRLIKQRWPDISVVVVTINVAAQEAALDAGANAFIIKGDSSERLLAALLAGHEARKL